VGKERGSSEPEEKASNVKGKEGRKLQFRAAGGIRPRGREGKFEEPYHWKNLNDQRQGG